MGVLFSFVHLSHPLFRGMLATPIKIAGLDSKNGIVAVGNEVWDKSLRLSVDKSRLVNPQKIYPCRLYQVVWDFGREAQ